MRIVGGRHKGQALAPIAGRAIRPTSDKTREAIFDILTHGKSAKTIEGARVLDLFAGSGALGLEALSRGARFCLFVDRDPRSRGLIRRNIELLQQTGTTRLWRRDATRLGAGSMAAFDIVFVDPPYGRGLGVAALASLIDGQWLAPDAAIMVEEHKTATLTPPPELVINKRRLYGDTQLLFLKPTA
ncbi:MAG: 16S rRNA (guanine(966)-N(2))-methyltransferase RsmD [Hyphomicrobiales bacterium]